MIQCQIVLSAVEYAMSVAAMLTVMGTKSVVCQVASESVSVYQVLCFS